MKISKLLNTASAAVLSSVLTLGQMGSALADDGNAQQQQAQPVSTQQAGQMNSAQLRDMASDYSMQNGGRVGIFINIAPDTKLTPQQLGSAIVKKFAAAGIEAAYVSNYAKSGTSTVTYYMNGYVWPGYDFGAAPQGFNEVVESYRAMKALEREVSGASTPSDEIALNQ